MAGSDPRFNATTFRDAIHFVMAMAKPTTTTEQLQFTWRERDTFPHQGPTGSPFLWDATPTTTHTFGPVTIPVAFQMTYRQSETQGSPIGEFDQPLLELTILDTDYPSIFDDDGNRADFVIIPDTGTFEISFEAPPVALFDVTVHTLYARALDNS